MAFTWKREASLSLYSLMMQTKENLPESNAWH